MEKIDKRLAISKKTTIMFETIPRSQYLVSTIFLTNQKSLDLRTEHGTARCNGNPVWIRDSAVTYKKPGLKTTVIGIF